MAYWRHTDQPAALATTLPKPSGMPPQPDWDRLTTATFPPDLLSWSYHSAELPANSELLGLASLNFEYHYFAAPSEKGMAEESLLRRVQTLGTSIIEHDARLSGIEQTAVTLRERIGGLEAPDAIRDQRLAQLERPIEERSARLSSLESSLEGYSELISSLAVRDTTRDERLAAIEAGIEEHRLQIGSTEAENAVRDQRLESLEQTIEERAGRISGVENRLEEQEQRAGAIDAMNAVRDERLSSVEGTVKERTGRLLAVESRLQELQGRVAAQEAELREIARHSDRAIELETLLHQQVDRIAAAEQAALASVGAEQQRLQAIGGEVAELRATIDKALYALALLQESLQGIDADLSQSRLSRIEAELSSVSASGEKPNSNSLI
jgi:chromosome segregation ATPase